MRFASVTFQQVSISLSAAEEATGERAAFPRWSQAAELFTSRLATHCRRSAQQCTTEIIVERKCARDPKRDSMWNQGSERVRRL